jgi:hypothetical protein
MRGDLGITGDDTMNYAKLIDGQLQFAPEHMRRADGSSVIGYNREPSFMLADGFKPVVSTDRPGEYYAASWQEYEKSITQVWTAFDQPAPPPPPPDPLEPFAVTIQAFGALWASLQIGPVPADWTEAMALLADQPADVQIKLLAFRVALIPVWGILLERMAGNA